MWMWLWLWLLLYATSVALCNLLLYATSLIAATWFAGSVCLYKEQKRQSKPKNNVHDYNLNFKMVLKIVKNHNKTGLTKLNKWLTFNIWHRFPGTQISSIVFALALRLAGSAAGIIIIVIVVQRKCRCITFEFVGAYGATTSATTAGATGIARIIVIIVIVIIIITAQRRCFAVAFAFVVVVGAFGAATTAGTARNIVIVARRTCTMFALTSALVGTAATAATADAAKTIWIVTNMLDNKAFLLS